MGKVKKETTFGFAALAMIACFAFIMIPGALLGAKIHVMFLLSWLIAIPLCMTRGYTYQELQSGMIRFIPKCIVPVLLILSIGSLIGSWCASGTIAYITYLGLQVINPRYFMATAFVVTLICALFTGTSFGTCGTIGVALMGVALGMGLDPLWAASPILCAAVVGDGLSPLSDTPNVIAGSAGVDMFESVKFQLPMTIPVAILTFLVYFIMGLTGNVQSADSSTITTLLGDIYASYNLGIHCLLPIILVFGLLIAKVPAIPSILVGSLSGLCVACLAQGQKFASVIGAMWSGFSLQSENEMVSSLFSRGGVSGMTGTCVLIIFSFGLFGILNEAKVLDVLVEPLANMIHSRLSGVICVIILGFLANLSSSASFSEVFTGNIMSPVYEKAGLNKLDLTRAATVGCLAFSMFIPFVVMPATVTASLGVDPVQMIPYYISMPIYLIVIVGITALNLDKKMLEKMSK
ncbi:MAG: sodium:proton antiporter [Clostridiales bacterium]|nr:sodium:proton antiporter [Clostridiales bacterium]